MKGTGRGGASALSDEVNQMKDVSVSNKDQRETNALSCHGSAVVLLPVRWPRRLTPFSRPDAGSVG